MQQYEFEYKVCFLGNTGVGKTSIVKKLLTGNCNIDDDSYPTIGVAFQSMFVEKYKFDIK